MAELSTLVRTATTAGQGIYPVGGRTSLDVGLVPSKTGYAVDMTALDQIIDYPARDMTITVRAGITIGKLQETLAQEGQWLPVDIPLPSRATLGGAVALNQSGPRRVGSGTLRDYVIGISFVTDEGDEVKAGGRVVKNVAGYDLMKLQTGAVGTLGVITQLTLKVKPKPEASVRVTFGCETSQLGAVLDLLHASNSRPAALELLNAVAWNAAGIGGDGSAASWMVVVGFEEKASTVDWQVQTLLTELRSASVRDVIETCGPAAQGVWQVVTNLQRRVGSRLIWKASVLPSKVAELLQTIAQKPWLIHSEPLNGIVWFHSPDGVPAEPMDPELASLEQAVTTAGGNFCITRCPTAWKKTLQVWGRPKGDWELMRQVKQALDPKGVFNPGRLFRGL